MPLLQDKLGRVIENLRISVTDRCNFRCQYCMPEEGMEWFDRSEILHFEEIERLVRIFAGLGLSKIRITGGEPLVRRGVPELIRRLCGIPGIRDIGMTTNGYFLRDHVEELESAGLQRLNVSVDSLIAERFDDIVRRKSFARVMEGLAAAARTGIRPIKINVVSIRGINDDEILPFAEFARTNGYVVRFIEYMPIGGDNHWKNDLVVPTEEIIQTINARYPIEPLHWDGKYPARRFRFLDGDGELGFISSVTDPFCGTCNRVRITADGKFRTCLFSLGETDLKGLLRAGADDTEVADAITKAVWNKEPGHLINQDAFVKPTRSMSQIGG